jgi:hypothetical protein
MMAFDRDRIEILPLWQGVKRERFSAFRWSFHSFDTTSFSDSDAAVAATMIAATAASPKA